MSNKWLVGLLFLYFTCIFISGIAEYQQMGTEDASIFHDFVVAIQATSTADGLGVVTAWINVGWTGLGMLINMFWFNFAIFQGQWGYVRIILLAPVVIPVLISFVLSFGRGTSST